MYRVILKESAQQQSSKFNFKDSKLIEELAFHAIDQLKKQLSVKLETAPLYQVLGSMTESVLRQGDVLKIGNVRLIILQLSNQLHEQKLIDLKCTGWQKLLDCPGLIQQEDQHEQQKPQATPQVEQDCFICRDSSPQFTLTCKCKGGMSRVHINCFIQHLRQSKQIRRNSNWLTYKPQFFKCKICQEMPSKPFKFHILPQVFQRLQSKSQGPFMLMYALNRHHQEIGYGMINGQGTFYVGRHYKLSNVYLKDVSVSRNACIFSFNQKKQWVVKQSKNKFGVLRPLKQIEGEGKYLLGTKLIQILKM